MLLIASGSSRAPTTTHHFKPKTTTSTTTTTTVNASPPKPKPPLTSLTPASRPIGCLPPLPARAFYSCIWLSSPSVSCPCVDEVCVCVFCHSPACLALGTLSHTLPPKHLLLSCQRADSHPIPSPLSLLEFPPPFCSSIPSLPLHIPHLLFPSSIYHQERYRCTGTYPSAIPSASSSTSAKSPSVRASYPSKSSCSQILPHLHHSPTCHACGASRLRNSRASLMRPDFAMNQTPIRNTTEI